MWRPSLLGLLLLVGCGVEGIHSANPTTVLRVNPLNREVYISNNKDVDVSVANLSYDPETKAFIIEDLKILDQASTVRQANVDQITAIGQQAQAIGMAWYQGMLGGAQLVRAGVPILGGLVPNPIWGGGQPGAVPDGWIYVGPGSVHTQPAPIEGEDGRD